MCGFFSEWKKKKATEPEIKPKEEYSPQRLIEMGKNYESGKGLPLDLKKAMMCYSEASNLGESSGTFNLGRMYFLGLGTTTDRKQGLALIERAASEGCCEALVFLGNAYYSGNNLEKDRIKALRYLKGAADKGDMNAMYTVGMMYKIGDGVDKNPKEAYKYLNRADRLGHPLAHEAIFGKNYTPPTPSPEPSPVKRDVPKPDPAPPASDNFITLLSSAKAGNADAMYRIGMMYLEGKNVAQNCLEAVNWLRKSADKNHTGAIIKLGEIHSTTAYGMYAPLAAFEKYVQAARAGRDEYIIKAIDIYKNYQGSYEGEKLLKELAKYEYTRRDNIYADFAHIFVKADGVDPDPNVIAKWVKKASSQGITLDYEWINEAVRISKDHLGGSQIAPVRHYRWKYKVRASGGYIKKQANYDMRIRYKDYLRYAKANVERWPSDPDGHRVFVTPKDPYVKEIATYIMKITRGLSPMERANCALKFVQSFRYTSDKKQFNEDDYAMYPLEMLWTQTGDCEDFAILFVSIMKAMGFDMALIRVKCPDSGHMGAGVCHPDAKGHTMVLGNKKYVYCEATSTTSGDNEANLKDIGVINEEYRLKRIIPIF